MVTRIRLKTFKPKISFQRIADWWLKTCTCSHHNFRQTFSFKVTADWCVCPLAIDNWTIDWSNYFFVFVWNPVKLCASGDKRRVTSDCTTRLSNWAQASITWSSSWTTHFYHRLFPTRTVGQLQPTIKNGITPVVKMINCALWVFRKMSDHHAHKSWIISPPFIQNVQSFSFSVLLFLTSFELRFCGTCSNRFGYGCRLWKYIRTRSSSCLLRHPLWPTSCGFQTLSTKSNNQEAASQSLCGGSSHSPLSDIKQFATWLGSLFWKIVFSFPHSQLSVGRLCSTKARRLNGFKNIWAVFVEILQVSY